MTTRELSQALQRGPDIEVGHFDGEDHWCVVTGMRCTQVDEADWSPLPHEKQTGKMSQVIELASRGVTVSRELPQ